MMEAHKFPKPLWNRMDFEVKLPDDIVTKMNIRSVEPFQIIYVPNEQLLRAFMEMRIANTIPWSEKAITLPFPKALHGPDRQSVTVRNQAELEAALANGWSLKPIVEEQETQMPPSPFRAPLPKREAVEPKEPMPAAPRGPGRPKREVASA